MAKGASLAACALWSQRMFRMRILWMRMIVIMVMMIVTMVVIMVVVVMVMIAQMQPALTRAPRRAEITILNCRAGGRSTLTFHMVMVAFLNRSNLGFKPQNLRAILAQNTGRRRHIAFGHMIAPAFRCRDNTRRATIYFQHLCTIPTGPAVRDRYRSHLFFHALCKRCQHLLVVVQIPCFDEFNLGIFRSALDP